MFGLDELIGGVANGHGAVLVALVAFALGVRHASDPDHLVAVSTLVAGAREHAARAAALLGAAWAAGHATTLLAFGIPMLVLRTYLPEPVEAVAEASIGAIIVLLALRILVRWRRGAFHTHRHEHHGVRHSHLHSHADEAAHEHPHPVRSRGQAFLIGLVHGMAGSGGIALLLVVAVPDRRLAVLALCALVVGTALSMTALSALVGRLLGAATARRALSSAVPALGSLACLFGAWYAFGALGALH